MAHVGVSQRWRDEDGGVLGSWLVQAVLVLAVLGLVGYDVVAIGVTAFRLDDASRQVARQARDAYRSSDGSLQVATDAATTAATEHGATVTDVGQDGEDVIVTLHRTAPTLVVHRVGPLEDLAGRSATARAGLEAF